MSRYFTRKTLKTYKIGVSPLYTVILRQAAASYPYNGDVMLDLKKNFVLSADEKKRLNSDIKIGIYKELYNKSLLTNGELSFLLEKENRLSSGKSHVRMRCHSLRGKDNE